MSERKLEVSFRFYKYGMMCVNFRDPISGEESEIVVDAKDDEEEFRRIGDELMAWATDFILEEVEELEKVHAIS